MKNLIRGNKMEIAVIDYSKRETLDLIKQTVAQGTRDDEFALFIEQCKATGLNPFKKEIWCIVTSPDKPNYRKLQLMTGVNGFYAIANKNPQYDGMKINYGNIVDVPVIENQEGVKSIKAPEWVECEVYRKDRKYPQVFRAYWHEYAKDLVSKGYQGGLGKLTIWAKLSSTMLSKCAESMSLRKAFPQELNGFYTLEEMPAEFSVNNVKPVRQSVPIHPDELPLDDEDVEEAQRRLRKARKEEPLSNSFADDDIPEHFGEPIEAEAVTYDFKYNLEEIYKDSQRAEKFAAYCEKLESAKINFTIDKNTLYSESELKALAKERIIKE